MKLVSDSVFTICGIVGLRHTALALISHGLCVTLGNLIASQVSGQEMCVWLMTIGWDNPRIHHECYK